VQAESANKVILNGLKKRLEKAGTTWVEIFTKYFGVTELLLIALPEKLHFEWFTVQML
jgi:hypothetical protein